MAVADDRMNKIVSLCKRRGFIFQSSEIYGGLKSCYDYGPLGAELKRNIADQWWRAMVGSREDVVGIDASIMMHPKVWADLGSPIRLFRSLGGLPQLQRTLPGRQGTAT